MKVTYKSHNARMLFEITGETQKDLFRTIAQVQDTFEVDDSCGSCNGTNIHFNVRSIDGNDYYSLVCLDCASSLQFGQHKQGGTLFAKRSDVDRGWKRYVPVRQIEPGNGGAQ